MLAWLQETDLASTIGHSTLLLGLLSGMHLLGFTFVMGGTLVSTLRLTGLFLRDHDARTVTRPAARGVAIGLATSLATGILLFAPRAVEASLNRTFRVKMILLLAAAAFQFTLHRAVAANPVASPGQQQLAGAAAFLLWTGVALAGCAFILLE